MRVRELFVWVISNIHASDNSLTHHVECWPRVAGVLCIYQSYGGLKAWRLGLLSK